jgi:hypothetical protein
MKNRSPEQQKMWYSREQRRYVRNLAPIFIIARSRRILAHQNAIASSGVSEAKIRTAD